MKINKEKLLELYLSEVDKICNDCEWKSVFDAYEVIYIVSEILEKNPDLIENEN